MSQIEEFLRMIKNWRKYEQKQLINILHCIRKLNHKQQQKNLNTLSQALKTLHKQTNKASQSKNKGSASYKQFSNQWFAQLQKTKNHITNLLKDLPKLLEKKCVQKSQIKQIVCPKSIDQKFSKFKDFQSNHIMRVLYKNFLVNLQQKLIQDYQTNIKITEYLEKVLKLLLKQFNFDKNEKNKVQQNTKNLFNRLEKIASKFKDKSSTLAKIQMIHHNINPELVAKCIQIGFGQDQALHAKKTRQLKEQKNKKN